MPQLTATAKGYRQVFDISGATVTIGRSPDNDVVLPFAFISSHWARLERVGDGAYRFIDQSKVNPTHVDGKEVREALLHNGSELLVGSVKKPALTLALREDLSDSTMTILLRPDGVRRHDPGEDDNRTRIDRRPRLSATSLSAPATLDLAPNAEFIIGREASCQLRLDDLRISRRHARLIHNDGAVEIEDLSAANGVFVNGRRVRRQALRRDDVIRIGPYRFVYDEQSLVGFEDHRRARLDAVGVRRQVGDKVILDDVSVSVAPGVVFAIAGVSGAGKTTLLDALSGVRPPDAGHVSINGTDLYRNFDAIQSLIGYTPQQDIVHLELPVRRALMYSARLRLPPDVSGQEAAQRVDDVLRDLELWNRKDLEARKLSGGQLKRVSIATELIADPGLLFLDEPTSGLDPGTTRVLMEKMRELARAGRTIIMVTHDAESLAACDQMVFLASGGRVAFSGSPKEALEHFGVEDIADIYKKVEDEKAATHLTGVWRTAQHGTAALPTEPELAADPVRLTGRQRQRRSGFSQFRVLLERRFEILLRDRRNLALLMVQAPVIGLLLALVMGADAFDPVGALPSDSEFRESAARNVPPGALASALPLILAATAVWFGAINSAREIVKELPVFLRERQAGLRVAPYMVSKLIVLGLLSAVQVAVLLAIVWAKVDIPFRGVYTFGVIEVYVSLALAALAGMSIGLLISASVTNADRAQSLVPIFLIPQIIFVGGPLASSVAYAISSLTITRWAIEAVKVAVEIPYRGLPREQATAFDGEDLLLRWGVLAGMSLLFLAVATILVRARGAKV